MIHLAYVFLSHGHDVQIALIKIIKRFLAFVAFVFPGSYWGLCSAVCRKQHYI